MFSDRRLWTPFLGVGRVAEMGKSLGGGSTTGGLLSCSELFIGGGGCVIAWCRALAIL